MPNCSQSKTRAYKSRKKNVERKNWLHLQEKLGKKPPSPRFSATASSRPVLIAPWRTGGGGRRSAAREEN